MNRFYRLRTLAALLLALIVSAQPAHAFLLYLEGGGGISLWFAPQATFPTFNQVSSHIAPSWSGGLHATFGNGQSPLGFHIGAKFRSSVGNILTATGFTSYQLATLYPEIKIQLSLITLAFGASPLIWTRTANNWGLDGLQYPGNAMAYFAEVGFIYAWTRTFSIGAAVTSQWVGSLGFFTGPFGPMPALDGQIYMRFYLWKQNIGAGTSNKGNEITPNEYKGWRYPFGWVR